MIVWLASVCIVSFLIARSFARLPLWQGRPVLFGFALTVLSIALGFVVYAVTGVVLGGKP